MMRSSVVLPQPDGPTSAATSPLASEKESSPRTCRLLPEAARKNFCLMPTSSLPGTPAGDMSFKRLHQECFDHQHDGHEGERIGEDARDVKQLERDPDLDPDPMGTAQSSTIRTIFHTSDSPERAAAAR